MEVAADGGGQPCDCGEIKRVTTTRSHVPSTSRISGHGKTKTDRSPSTTSKMTLSSHVYIKRMLLYMINMGVRSYCFLGPNWIVGR